MTNFPQSPAMAIPGRQIARKRCHFGDRDGACGSMICTLTYSTLGDGEMRLGYPTQKTADGDIGPEDEVRQMTVFSLRYRAIGFPQRV